MGQLAPQPSQLNMQVYRKDKKRAFSGQGHPMGDEKKKGSGDQERKRAALSENHSNTESLMLEKTTKISYSTSLPLLISAAMARMGMQVCGATRNHLFYSL